MTGPVAILGASGFIGGRMVEMFHLSGLVPVRPVARRAAGLALSARFALDGRVADGRDESALASAFAGCDGVVHAIAGDMATITETIAPVYRAAALAGVRRLVYLSSASVHGQSPAPGTDEASPLDDRQALAYNNAKIAAERSLLALRKDGAVEVVILRPGIVHGPRSFWCGGFADRVLEGRAALVEGGRGVCNSVYVDNLAHAVSLALAVPGADSEAFLVGDAEPVTWADLLGPIAVALGRDPAALSVPLPSPFDRRREKRAERMREGLRIALSPFPSRVRAAVRSGLDAYRGKSGPDAPGPDLSAEIVDLHTCRVRLGHDKATRVLGYHPPVSFNEAVKRTLAWLAFAGYPVRLTGVSTKDRPPAAGDDGRMA